MIKLHKPFLGIEEKKAINEILDAGEIGSGGKAEALFQKDLKSFFQVKYAFTVPSGTAALELAVASLDLKLGDEVIIPSFTFPSDATAVLLQGASLKFADIDPVYFNIDPKSIIKQISPKTKAIIIVHYAGMSCQMDEIMAIAKKFKLKVIEDACHSWGSRFKGKLLGTMGDVNCFSLHATKNITAGEGGVVLTNKYEIYRKAEIYRQVGTNRYLFFQRKIKKYEWISSKGSSYYLSSLQSAMARAQLKKLDAINKERNKVAKMYMELLNGVKEITLPKVPPFCEPNWHVFAILVKNNKRDKLMEFLKSKKIEAVFHYLPLHSSKMGRELGYKTNDLKVTQSVATSLLRLPIYPGLTDSNIKYITGEIKRFFKEG